MPTWTLRLLGDIEIESPVGVRRLRLARKGRSLLLHVAGHGSAGVPRVRLLSLLWDDHPPEDARNALRQCLHHVRAELAEAAGILANESDRIVLRDVSCTVDSRLFETLAKGPEESALVAAVAWYRGDFAEALEADGEFRQWADVERERLRALAHDVVARLSQLEPGASALDDTIRLARRLLATDRLHEGTARALMRLYARVGLRSNAMQVWADCRRALHDELGVSPSEQTAALAAALMADGSSPRSTESAGGQPAWWPASSTPHGSTLRSIDDPQVMDLMLRGWQLFSTYTADGHAKARAIYERVIERVPRHADALALLGWTHWFDSIGGWAADPERSFRCAAALAERAVACGPENGPPRALMGKVLLWQQRHADALGQLQQAVALAPGYSYMHFHLGEAAMWCGRPEESLIRLERALRLDPNDHGVFLTVCGMAHWMAGDAPASRATLESALRRNPSYPWAHGMLTVVHHEAGSRDCARRAASAGRRLNRRFSVQFASRVMPFLLPEHRARVAQAWQQAGMPELAADLPSTLAVGSRPSRARHR